MSTVTKSFVATVAVSLTVSFAFAATPGLPFTEDFADTGLMDAANTTANWSTEEQALLLEWQKAQYGAFGPDSVTGTDISADAQASQGITLGDVDGDGDLDLVVGNYLQRNRLYLNNGTGDPWLGVGGIDITADAHDTRAVALGDVDGDGDLDLVAGNKVDGVGQVNRLYLNNGTDNPWNGVDGSNITDDAHETLLIALGDVDRDGDLDFIAGNTNQANRLYLNNGTNDPWFAVGGVPITSDADFTHHMALADVDADGDLDLVVGNHLGRNRLYLNTGTSNPWGGIAGTDITSDEFNTYGLALGDVDGDADLDLVTLDVNGNCWIRLYANNGTVNPWNGAVAVPIASDVPGGEVALGDVDADGDLDLFVGNQWLFVNNGSSTPFAGVSGTDFTSDASNSPWVALGDVDADGDLDLVTGSYGSTNRLYLNNASANPWADVSGSDIVSPTVDTEQTCAVELVDLNNDGHLDLVVGNSYATPGVTNRVYLNNGTSDPWNGVTAANLTADVHTTRALAVADFDGDGDLDIVAGNSHDTQTNRYYENQGTGTFLAGIDISSDTYHTIGLAAGDVDGDGDIDLIAGNSDNSGIPELNRLYLNNGTSNPWNPVSAASFEGVARITLDVLLADVNGDAHLDLVEANESATAPYGEINRVYINNGTSTPFSGVTGTDITSDAYWTHSLAVGDVDGDGDLDLVTGNHTTVGSSRLYLNDGDSDPWDTAVGIDLGTGPVIAATDIGLADVNGDGLLDVVTASPGDGDKMILNNGTADPFGGVEPIIFNTDLDETRSFALGDVDSDGDLDYVSGSFLAGESNRLYLSQAADNGGLHPWNENLVVGTTVVADEASWKPLGLAFGDVNGDGRIDMVAGAIGGTNVGAVNRVFLNNATADPWEGVVPINITSDVDETFSVALGDVDGDGDLDVVVGNAGNEGDGYVNRLYVNVDGTGTNWLGSNITSDEHQTQCVALSDMDGDGDLDLVTGDYFYQMNRVYLNDGDGDPWDTVVGSDIGSTGRSTTRVLLGDVDRDGDLDVVEINLGTGWTNRLFRNDGSGCGWAESDITSDAGYRSEPGALADVDGDGDLDLVVGTARADQPIRLYLNDGLGDPWDTTVGLDVTSDTYWTNSLALADVDGDGDLDLLASNAIGEGNRLLYLNDGSGDPWDTVSGVPIAAESLNNSGVAAVDVDHDGQLEMIFAVTSGAYRIRLYDVPSFGLGSNFGTSLKINDTETGVASLRFNASTVLPPTTSLAFWLSNDGGSHWLLAPPSSNFVFPTPGDDLRWRAELRSLSPRLSPRVDTIELCQNAPYISPVVPNVATDVGVVVQYDLTSHEHDAEDSDYDLNWSIDPDDTSLYSASIDAEDVLTVTPKPGQSDDATATLTLMDSDSLTATQDIIISVTSTGPTPPTPFILPLAPMETDDLICYVSGGTVGPGLTAEFEYNWSNGGDPVIHGPQSETHDVLEASYTLAGDVWTCTVRTFDGTDYSVPSQAASSGVIGALEESTLTLGVVPDTVALGHYVTLNGDITPVVWGAPVSFNATETPPGGTDTRPSAQTTGSFGNFSFAFLPDEAGGWSFHAEWPGNENFIGDYDVATVVVDKAQPELDLELSHTSALLNLEGAEDFQVTATVWAPGFPVELLPLLAGLTVRLSVMTPEGTTPYVPLEKTTAEGGCATFTATDFANAGILFDMSGSWRFKAEFVGNENFLLAASEDFDDTTARLTIKEGAGYAIVVLGQLDEYAEGRLEHMQSADYIHQVLLDRNFDADDIYYMRDHGAGDYAPTAANLQSAIEVWAREKMLESPAPLYVILVGHGSTGKLHLDIPGTGPQEYITAAQLNDSLNILQSALGEQKVSAAEQDIFVIYGGCHSGSLIPVLSGASRIIITSCQADEISYRGVRNWHTFRRDGEFFLMEFFHNAACGRTVKESFERACTKTYRYTNKRSRGRTDEVPQHPLLDDNGDGVGTSGQLSTMPGCDGARVAGMDLGLGVNAGNAISWFTVSPPQYLQPAGAIEPLHAETTGRGVLEGDEAWLEIKIPSYDSGELADMSYEAFQRVAKMVGPVAPGADPTPLEGDKYLYEWTQADLEADEDFDGFTQSGTYMVYYFLRDSETGQVGAYLVTNIYVAQPGNQAPPPVALLYPQDGAIVNPKTFFAWTETTDPEGESVTYQVEVSEDPAFPEGATFTKSTTETVTQLDEYQDLLTGYDYYWRVIPVDPYGASPGWNDTRLFLVRGNPGVPGAITGYITSASTDAPIEGAVATTVPGAKEGAASFSGRYFIGELEQGVYNLDVSAAGYEPTTVTGVYVDSNSYTIVDVALSHALGNHPPALAPIGDKETAEGSLLTFTVAASDSDEGDSLTFLASNLPPGANFDELMGVFTWSPVEGDAGIYTGVTFLVMDDGEPQMLDSETITITVGGGATIFGPNWVELGDRAVLIFYAEGMNEHWEYQWKKNEFTLVGQNTPSLTISNARFADEGEYKAVGWDTSKAKIPYASATFYLRVVESLPLAGGLAVLALATALAAAVALHRRRR